MKMHMYRQKGSLSLCGRTDDQTRQTNEPIRVRCLDCIRRMEKNER